VQAVRDEFCTIRDHEGAHIALTGRTLPCVSLHSSAARTGNSGRALDGEHSGEHDATTGRRDNGGTDGPGATMANDTPPRWDRKMQQRLARGEAAALGELYDRFASLVHGLAHRVLDDERAADHTTREVFAHIWENPHAYDPKRGPLRSFLAELTQQLATARLRRWHREDAARRAGGADSSADSGSGAGAGGGAGQPSPERCAQIEEKVRAASAAARADYIVTSMPASLRATLELAYFQRRDYRQAARQLGVTEDEARRRLRLGLQLLSSAMTQTTQTIQTAQTPQPPAPQDSPGGPR